MNICQFVVGILVCFSIQFPVRSCLISAHAFPTKANSWCLGKEKTFNHGIALRYTYIHIFTRYTSRICTYNDLCF